ncbi:MAG TPA: hypothetical protein VD908_11780 [Cytophagales bacterium]|nr:hypothetical protein [Cytophagales bacterium]
MIEKKLKIPVGITVFIGVILKLMNNPYGSIVFTIGFAGYFLLKLIRLSRTQKFFWTKYHYIQLGLLILGIGFLILMYFNYPYSRLGFVIVLLLESIVSLRIMITSVIGDSNFRMILSFLGKLLRR